MNKILLFSLVFISLNTLAQIPENYYSSAEGLSGEELKTSLYNIIKGHSEYPYSSGSTDVWDILKETDKDPNNQNNVILFYSGWSVNAAQEFNNENGWNREHIWAKSRGDFGTSPGPGTDVHHLRPSDITVNAARGNRWFADCTEPYFDGGQNTGCFLSSTEHLWQPREEIKGDVARMIFYMAVRYEGQNGEPDLEMVDYFPDSYTKEPIHAKFDEMYQWHIEDPVDNTEQKRNDIIYNDFQHNRNPFIDHPEYAGQIWQLVTNINKINTDSSINLYPNPAQNNIKISTNNINNQFIKITISDIQSKKLLIIKPNSNNISIDISGLDKGLYFVKIKTNNFSTCRKILKL